MSLLFTRQAQIFYVITSQFSTVFSLFLGSIFSGPFQQVFEVSPTTLNTRRRALPHVGHGTPDLLTVFDL